MELIKFSEKDFLGIKAFMTPLWRSTYGEILPREQIDFLIDKYFSDEGLRYFRALGYKYFKIMDGDMRGVAVICEKDGSTYLDKLYLSENSRGKGYASFVFSELLKMGKDITLNVNRGNARALRCYFKNGFTVESEEIIELGNGMVNRDYNLRLTKGNFDIATNGK
ncbi:MAG: GNAT family N-acetyltransferase [Clostridia bacterium]|nr:GNAT family N-acetyltransferase [Clostridia bacterium]